MRNQFGFSFLAATLLTPVAFAQSSDLDAVQVPAAADQEVTVTYKPGSGVKFSGENFEVAMGGNVMVDYYFMAGDVNPDQSTFNLREARFYLKGKLYHTNTSFKLMFEGKDNTQPIKDAWLKQGLWKNEDGSMGLSLRFGQQKVAFGREWNTSSTAREFISQSIAGSSFSGVRTSGGQLTLEGKAGDKNCYRVNFGAFNTSFQGGAGTTATTFTGEQGANPDNKLNYVLSADYAMNGLKLGSDQGDLARSEEMKFGIGAGIFIGNEEAAGADIDIFSWNVNAAVAMNGFFGQIDVFGYTAEADTPGAQDESHLGFTLQGSYTFVDDLYVAARFSMVSLDNQTNFMSGRGWASGLGNAQGDQMNVSLAAGKYYNGHNNKLQAEITFETIDFDASAATDVDNIIFGLRYSLRI
ncbi:MAG: hypothetical protein CSA62_08225 [Planctomycetota bacterium]|nr:MAG: hypothetical protein CSA62_08225 [Planctomycetota bacterium]